jgi:hypothetical protein
LTVPHSSDSEVSDNERESIDEGSRNSGSDSEDEDTFAGSVSLFGDTKETKFDIKIKEILQKEAVIEDFVSKIQPGDKTRHFLALLEMPAGKIYAEHDLDNEFTIKVGLHLLHNKIQGKDELHLKKSIHIKYSSFLP